MGHPSPSGPTPPKTPNAGTRWDLPTALESAGRRAAHPTAGEVGQRVLGNRHDDAVAARPGHGGGEEGGRARDTLIGATH